MKQKFTDSFGNRLMLHEKFGVFHTRILANEFYVSDFFPAEYLPEPYFMHANNARSASAFALYVVFITANAIHTHTGQCLRARGLCVLFLYSLCSNIRNSV